MDVEPAYLDVKGIGLFANQMSGARRLTYATSHRRLQIAGRLLTS